MTAPTICRRRVICASGIPPAPKNAAPKPPIIRPIIPPPTVAMRKNRSQSFEVIEFFGFSHVMALFAESRSTVNENSAELFGIQEAE